MKCPFCGAAETTVADTRINDDGDIVRRRRRCLSCDKRFSTYERAEIRLPQVVKKNGSRVDFDRERLSASLWLALRKRPVTVETVDAALSRIEEKLLCSKILNGQTVLVLIEKAIDATVWYTRGQPF